MIVSPYEILGHTADLRLRVTGATVEELFLNALAGMAHIMAPDVASGETPRQVRISSADMNALLVDFLNEALYFSNVYKEVYPDAIFSVLGETELEAELKGAPVHEFEEDIKAATHHEAEIRKDPAGYYEVTIVFDI